MLSGLSKKLFPNAYHWERRRKMFQLVTGVIGAVLLVITVAIIMIWSSSRHFGSSSQ